MAITKDMSILEVVQKYPDTVDVFVNSGMGCLGCRYDLLIRSIFAADTNIFQNAVVKQRHILEYD